MKKALILTVFLALTSYNSFGWGEKGHKIVAAIAKKCLKQNIIDSVQKYLDIISFEEASVWMDEVRNDRKYDSLSKWHFVNVDKDKTYIRTEEPNVIEAIKNSIETLSHRKLYSRSELNFQLKVLFHLVGDIHQPLHCGYAEDRGGNEIKVIFKGKKSNLHKVWDTEIIEAAEISLNDCLVAANEMTAAEKKEALNLDAEIWTQECRELLPEIYNFERKIMKSYITQNEKIIRVQLVKAGIRLAAVLTKCFSS